MSLEEIEAFRRDLKVCPECGSSEGFWLTAKQDKSFVQCKHCGAIIELCKTFSEERAMKKREPSKHGFLKIKLKS